MQNLHQINSHLRVVDIHKTSREKYSHFFAIFIGIWHSFKPLPKRFACKIRQWSSFMYSDNVQHQTGERIIHAEIPQKCRYKAKPTGKFFAVCHKPVPKRRFVYLAIFPPRQHIKSGYWYTGWAGDITIFTV
jgi:hypothetical protein